MPARLDFLIIILLVAAQLLGQEPKVTIDQISPKSLTFFGPSESLAEELHVRALNQQVTTLESVSLQQHTVSNAEIRSLAACKRLVALEIGDYPDSVVVEQGVIDVISKLTTLESLSIYASDISFRDVEQLKSLDKLKYLTLFGKWQDEPGAVSWLGNCPKLESLIIDGVINEDFNWLSRLTQLQFLSVRTNKLDRSFFVSLDNAQELRGLAIDLAVFGSDELNMLSSTHGNAIRTLEIAIEDSKQFELLSRFPKLERLGLAIKKGGVVNLDFVQHCKGLKSVHIRGGEVREQNLECLDKHGTLQHFIVTDEKGTKERFAWSENLKP